MREEQNDKKMIRMLLFWSLLILLLALAIWQMDRLFRLWTDTPGGNEASSRVEEIDAETGLLRPAHIYASSGAQEGKYARLGDQNEHYFSIYSTSWNWLKTILTRNNDTFLIEADAVPETGMCCRYTYAAALPSSLLKEFGDIVLPEQQFDTLLLIPASTPAAPCRVYLLAQEGEQAVEIVNREMTWRSEESQQFCAALTEACDKTGEHYYNTDIFFPERFSQTLYMADASAADSQYLWKMEKRSFSEEAQARSYSSHFFEYPELISTQQLRNGWLFSDDVSSVRVEQDGYLEYSRTPTQEIEVTFNEAYRMAWEFLKEDFYRTGLTQNVVLTGWEAIGGGYRFIWNYRIEEWIVEMDTTESAITLETKGSCVSHYQRPTLRFEADLDTLYPVRQNVRTVLDQIGLSECDECRLIYRLEEEQPELCWKVTKDGQSQYVPALS